MVSFDIETYEPHLRKLKFHSLDPELMQDVLEVANELGLEATVTSETNLDFLFRIYHSERRKRDPDAEKLEKAEDLILKLAGFYTLRHGRARPQEKKEEKPFRGSMHGGRISVSERSRELLRSVGISSERQMELTVEQIGESKIEERVRLVRESPLGKEVVSELFNENPDALRMPDDRLFECELRAMVHKRDFLDAWKRTSGQEPPLWADYTFSPSVLFSDYNQIICGLGIETGPFSADVPGSGYPQIHADDLHLFFERFGYRRAEDASGLVFEHPGGRIITLSNPEGGMFDPLAVARIIADMGIDPKSEALEEITVPANPKARKKPSAPPRPREEGRAISDLLSIFQRRGIDVSRLSSSYDIVSSDAESASDPEERERFESTILLLSDLIFAHDLERKINMNLGSEGLRISGVKYLSGASGAFELMMDDGRRIYLNMQDMKPALIGREVIEAAGMVSNRIWTSSPGGAYLASDGRAYAVSEDARRIGGLGRIRLRMPDLSMEEVETRGAAMFREDIVLRPDLSDDLHRDFYDSMTSEPSRKKILRSLLGYFEMSRRCLLPDRRPPNTCLLMVRRDSGETEFTFQPTDLDGIGNFICDGAYGPDFSEFDRDFRKAALYFAVQIHEGMLRAGIQEPPSVRRLLLEMEELSLEPFQHDGIESIRARERVFKRHHGSLIGIGFDASRHVGSTIPSQGERKEIVRQDGRVRLDSEAMIRTAAASMPMDYLSGIGDDRFEYMLRLPKSIARIAISIAKARAMPEGTAEQMEMKSERLRHLLNRTGGEIADRICGLPGFPEGSDEGDQLSFAQSAAMKELTRK